jgi:hypothetical protein
MAPRQSPAGYGRLARRLTDWTTKGLFSALVLVGGLGFGRQVIRWWHDDDLATPKAPLAASPFDLSDTSQPIDISIGELPYRFVRQTMEGDQQEAMRSLQTICQRSLASATPWSPIADANEEKLLERLSKLDFGKVVPHAQDDSEDDGRLYEPVPGMPLIVGTRRSSAASLSDAIAPENRVVLWGLAAPAGERRWTLCLFQADARSPDGELQSEFPLPPGCQRLLALRGNGAEISAFQGSEPCEKYRVFFTECRSRGGLRWQRTEDGGWYGSINSDADTPHDRPASLVIQLVPGKFGGCTGLLQRVQQR